MRTATSHLPREDRTRRLMLGALLLVGSLLPAGAVFATEAGEPDPTALRAEGFGLLREVRQSTDQAVTDEVLARAEDVFLRLRDVDPQGADALIGLGSIALTRHDFEGALELGTEANRLAPAAAPPHGIIADALIELGRYEEAGTAIEAMLAARPDLPSYSRLSYYHELHGRLDLAIDAMERALLAAGTAPADTEFARALLGDLWRLTGDLERARTLYEVSLERLPGYEPALHGLARTAAAEGDTEEAMRLLEAAIAAVPEADTNIDLGELHEMAGDATSAERHYATALELEAAALAARASVEPDMAIVEADLGDPTRALELATEAYAAAPSILAADALAWALHVNGRTEEAGDLVDEALRTGSSDPDLLYRAGVIRAATGEVEAARMLLDRALAGAAAGSPLLETRIRAAFEALPSA